MNINPKKFSSLLSYLTIALILASQTAHAQRGGGGGRGGGKGGARAPAPTKPMEVINPFAPDAEPTVGLRQRIEAIEQYSYRHQEGGSLEKRVHRLEARIVPWEHPKADASLDDRVDHLWALLSAANSKKIHDEGYTE